MNYSNEHIFNRKALDYMIDRVLQENEEKHKKIHDDLIRDINNLKGQIVEKDHQISELNKRLIECNKKTIFSDKDLSSKGSN